jgi:protein tyrosine/serine phosphatase
LDTSAQHHAAVTTTLQHFERNISWPACWNVRDLGGLETASGHLTQPRRIVRAGNLSKLTAMGRDALIGYGVRTVVDVRDPRELAIDMNPFHERGPWHGHLSYVNEPLISEEEWTAIRDSELSRRGYVLTLELSKQNVGRVLSRIADAAPGGVVVHCHAGKERTGLIAALILALAGVPDEVIADDYVASDRHLESLYDEWAARETDVEARTRLRNGFMSEPEHMLLPLQWIREHGGVDEYLMGCGLDKRLMETLRRRIVESRDYSDPTS